MIIRFMDKKYYILWGIISIIAIIISVSDYEGMCSDLSMPKNAITFAYEHMTTKDNVTFIKIESNEFERYCDRHYWVTDAEGTTYRLTWSDMHHDIKLNTPYSIKYVSGSFFNALWEYKNSSF
jgi:hypothetical protein